MCRCKACDVELRDGEARLRTLDTGEQIWEDLCRRCRSYLYFDLYELACGINPVVQNTTAEGRTPPLPLSDSL